MSNRAGMMRAVSALGAGVALLPMAGACGGDGSSGGGKEAGATPLPIDQVPVIGTLADDFTLGPNDRPSLGKYPLDTSVFDPLNNQRMESVFRVRAR